MHAPDQPASHEDPPTLLPQGANAPLTAPSERLGSIVPPLNSSDSPPLLPSQAQRPEIVVASEAFLGIGNDATGTTTTPQYGELPPVDAPSFAVPGYEILGELGRGAMGVVYRARQVKLNRTVALKMILSGAHAGSEERVRFLTEAEVVAAIQHPGIVGVHEFGAHQGLPYFALEYCPGGNLATKLNGTPLPPREAAVIVEQIARAVQAAHEKGVIHRDLKPGNVLMDGAGRPRVTDFGLARRMEGGSGLTQTGAVMGTPSYMAPEQARGSKDVGPGVDVYALGAILYECLTGRPPFKAATAYDTLLQVMADEPVSVRQLQTKVPRELETICHKCLQKESAQRYASAVELAEDLRRWQAGEPVKARPVGLVGRAWKWVRRSPLLAGMTAATVLALLGGTIVSTYFAIVAREQEKQAVKKEGETREALEQVEENLALGLLRPLGHFKDEEALNDFELDALEELASLPRERDRVRLLFIEKALASDARAGQLDRRLEESVIAAVGLRSDLRDKVLTMAGERLREKNTSRQVRLVCARLAAALAADDVGILKEAAAVLVMETDVLAELPKIFESLSGKIAPADAAVLCKQIVEMATKTSDAALLNTLSKAFGSLASKVAPADAVVLCKQIVELAGKTTDPRRLATLSDAFGSLSDKITPADAAKHAAALCKQVIKWVVKTTDANALASLSEAFGSLSSKVAPADAVVLCNQIVEIKTTGADLLATLSRAFGALSGKLPPPDAAKHAAALCKQIAELAGKTTDANALPSLTDANALASLSEAFGSLSSKVAPADAVVLCKQIVELAAKTPDHRRLATLSKAFGSLSGKLSPPDAAKHAAAQCKQIVELAGKPTEDNDLASLSEAFGTLSDKVAPADAVALCKQIIELAATTTDAQVKGALSKFFGSLSGKIPPTDAAKHAAVQCEQVVELAAKITDADLLDTLSRAFLDLSGKITPADAARHAAALCKQIVEEAAKTTDSQTLLTLSEAFGSLSGKIAPADAARRAAVLCKQILELAGKTTDAAVLLTLSKAFGAVSGMIAPADATKHAAGLCKQVVKLAAEDVNSHALPTLSKAVIELVPLLPREWARQYTGFLASRLAWTVHRRRNDQDLSITFKKLCELLPPQQLLDLLKQPGCVEPVRSVILKCLDRQLKRTFRDSWDLVEHVERKGIALDCSLPFNREQRTLKAGNRNPSGSALGEAGSSAAAFSAPGMIGD